MNVKEYVEGLEINSMALGAVSLTMKYFASQIIQHVQGGGRLDDAAFASIRAACVLEMKSIEVSGGGVPIEQVSEALNRGLAISLEMLDDVITRAQALKS